MLLLLPIAHFSCLFTYQHFEREDFDKPAKKCQQTSPTPTTTYPLVATTCTNPGPSPLSSYSITYTETKLLPRVSAATGCASASAFPEVYGHGIKAACIISNAI